jgi:hypothetical protein
MRGTTRNASVAGLLLAGSLAHGVPGSQAADKPVLTLRATAIDPGAATPMGQRPAGVGTLEIAINQWTTDAQHARLAAVLAEKGSQDLMDALDDLRPAGYIRTPTSLGWDIHYARQIALPDGGRRIIFATDRPMSFWEFWQRPRSAEYEYLLGEVRLGPDGRGSGTLVPAARIDYHEASRTIEVENYASQPVRLTEVHIEK